MEFRSINRYVFPALLSLAFIAQAQQRPGDFKTDGVRHVVRAVTRAAKSDTNPGRRSGDVWTEYLIREAAAAALTLPASDAVPSFLAALGLGLDNRSSLSSMWPISKMAADVESPAEREERLAVLGAPTIHGRTDYALHFVLSAALVEFLGAEMAERWGFAKESHDRDSARGSGYSFTDVNANLSGISFAARLKSGQLPLESVAKGFTIRAFVPSPAGLGDRLPLERFQEVYGAEDDPRFTGEIARIRERIRNLHDQAK